MSEDFMAERVLCIMGKIGSGGVESIVFSYYSALDKSKFQYDIVYENDSISTVPEELLSMGARAFAISPMSHPFSYISDLRKIMKNGDYKIVHCNNSTLSLFPLIAAKMSGIKIRIIHNHSTSSKLEKKRDLAKRVLRKIAPVFANKYCACSEKSGRWMYGDKAFEKGRVKLLRNAVDFDKYVYSESDAEQIKKEFNIENSTVIGHIGRFVTTKNHRFLIDVFDNYIKINNNSVLLLVGEGPLEADVKEYVKEKGLSAKVIFAGVRNDAYKFYSAFDILLLPSLYEGLPVVSVEASSAGLAQILSDNITRECRLNDGIKFLPIDSAELWASEIDKSLNNDRRKIAAQTRESRYDIKKCAKELEDYYTECLREI